MLRTVKLILSLFALAYVVAMVMTFSGCRTIKVSSDTLVKDSIVYTDRPVYIKLPPIRIPGDTVKLRDTVPCPDAKWKGEAQSKSGKTAVKAELNNGRISVDCTTDSLLLQENDSLKAVVKDMQRFRETKITETVTVPDPYIPWYVWLIIGIETLVIIKLIFL